jgi:septal ring factor EnvC (AmiA/AmiB activator)
MVKVKPVASKGNINFELLIKELRDHIASQEKVIEQNNDQTQELSRQINRIKEAIERSKKGLPIKSEKNTKNKQMAVEHYLKMKKKIMIKQTPHEQDLQKWMKMYKMLYMIYWTQLQWI